MTLTIDTLLFFWQAGTRNFQEAIDKATAFIEDRLQKIRDMPYALSIVTYALTMANHEKANLALDYLKALAKSESEFESLWCETESPALPCLYFTCYKPSSISHAWHVRCLEQLLLHFERKLLF